jgi:hypothetical protein
MGANQHIIASLASNSQLVQLLILQGSPYYPYMCLVLGYVVTLIYLKIL